MPQRIIANAPRLRCGRRALDIRETTVHRLTDRRRWLGRTAVAPHAFVPALASQAVGLADEGFSNPTLGRLLGEDAGHGPRLHQFLLKRLPVAARQGSRVMLRSHG